MMLKALARLGAIACALLLGSAAMAQAVVQQTGTITAGDAVVWAGNGQIMDGGDSTVASTGSYNWPGKQVFGPSSVYGAAINIAPGATPLTPTNGDLWVTSLGLYAQINGAQVGPFMANGTTQSANTVLAAPNGSAGAPSFRAIVAADIPTGGAAASLKWTDATAAGADPTGATDSTTAVQTALNGGATAFYFAPGTYKLCGVTIPHTSALHIFGAGTASKLMQSNCGLPVFQWSTSAMDYSEQTISDLYIDSTSGAANTIDTSGEGGVTLQNLYFKNVPAGYDAIYVNGAASTATHDVRVINNRFYSQSGGPSGNAKIEFGPLSADSLVSHNVGNGNFLDAYGVKIDAGATTIVSIQSNFYNVTSRALYALGCQNCQFSQDVWTTGTGGPNATVTATYSTFAGEQFEGATAGNDALQLVNSVGNTFTGTIWGASVTGAGYTVNESGSSNYNIFIGGTLNTLSYWATPPFHFIGAQSYALNVPGYSALGIRYGFSGATVSTQAQNTTVYLGVNGAQASATNTAYVSPYTSNVNTATIAVDVTPASGQTYAFTLYDSTTSTALGTCSIANGSYGCSITGSGTVNAGDIVSIKSVFSATSGAANVRYSIAMLA